jgi:hypothetical protein
VVSLHGMRQLIAHLKIGLSKVRLNLDGESSKPACLVGDGDPVQVAYFYPAAIKRQLKG